MLERFDVVPSMIEQGLVCPTWQFRDRHEGVVATFELSRLGADTSHPIGCNASSGGSVNCFTPASGRIPRDRRTRHHRQGARQTRIMSKWMRFCLTAAR